MTTFYKRRLGGNKYNAVRTEFNGRHYDSMFEASVAMELDYRLKAAELIEVIPQYKTETWAHRKNGLPAFKVSHKVDFRVTFPDGSYELIEAKGFETTDWKWRKKFLEEIWLPDNPDYGYRVRYINGREYVWKRKG